MPFSKYSKKQKNLARVAKPRIKAGSKEKMKKKGQKGRPTKENFRSAAKSARKKKI